MKIGNGWNVEYNQKPIPDRRHDWDFWHDDNCDTEVLCGTGYSTLDCEEQIAEIEEEHPYFNEEKQ